MFKMSTQRTGKYQSILKNARKEAKENLVQMRQIQRHSLVIYLFTNI